MKTNAAFNLFPYPFTHVVDGSGSGGSVSYYFLDPDIVKRNFQKIFQYLKIFMIYFLFDNKFFNGHKIVPGSVILASRIRIAGLRIRIYYESTTLLEKKQIS
jgi:hypothetical protein